MLVKHMDSLHDEWAELAPLDDALLWLDFALTDYFAMAGSPWFGFQISPSNALVAFDQRVRAISSSWSSAQTPGASYSQTYCFVSGIEGI